ncbi:MAG: sugar phosphate isomerase/epimerase [Clostridia bacterium]|nr:sugar phosphate isomerase/epimerase [Clostridia bacterium]
MKRKLGINVGCLAGIPQLEQLDMIHKAGFETFFTGSQNSDTIAGLKAKAEDYGMVFETIHAPFSGINNMWIPGMEYIDVYRGMKNAIDLAARHGVPAVVMHVSGGWYAPGISDLGLQRFDELVFHAAEKGVTIAFENLRQIGNLSYFSERYEKFDHVRFCYDFGHEHCYTKTVQWMDVFCHRLLCTHIHDNPGRTFEKVGSPDIHLLPFDGTVDYQRCVDKLDEYGYQGPLTLEVDNFRDKYPDLSPEEFLATCYERVKRISELSKAPDPTEATEA